VKRLIESWLESASRANANAENECIPPLDRRQCHGVAQAYAQCARDLESGQMWERIETAPKVLWARLLGATEIGVREIYWDGVCWRREIYDPCRPSHWMPLPQAPGPEEQ
jgi:hypothetical protein